MEEIPTDCVMQLNEFSHVFFFLLKRFIVALELSCHISTFILYDL